MNDLKIKNLRKTFDNGEKKIVAVDDFSVVIPKGQLVTLLGPSGCGKTTVLRMLGGFETPTSGSILLNEREISDLPPHRRNSTMVFQSYALFPHMSVRENILYGLKLRKTPSSQMKEKLQSLLQTVNLESYEHRKPNELSGGQQQRVALARAIIVEPDLLLFDEPLSNLDAKLRESMRIEIRALQKRLGITSVYVTHDQIEALAISDQVIVMNQGQVEQIGSPEDIYFHPKTFFVADFMGATNFLEVTIAQKDHQFGFEFEGQFFELNEAKKNEVSIGKSTLVCRPEAIEIASESSSKSNLEALITNSTFTGLFYECSLKTLSGFEFRAKFKARPNQKPLRLNEKVKLRFNPDFISFL
jgi:iron(III) transport system ATP-binding protein